MTNSVAQWLRDTSERLDISLAAWARKAGVAPSTVQRAVRDDYAFIPSTRTLQKLAAAVGVEPPNVFSPAVDSPPKLALIQVRHECGAGVWRPVSGGPSVGGVAYVVENPAFSGFEQWGERIVGDAYAPEYPEGTVVHVVEAEAVGGAFRAGDHVLALRTQGELVERSIWEVSRAAGSALAFVAVSQGVTPRRIDDVKAHGFEIVGLIVGDYRTRYRS